MSSGVPVPWHEQARIKVRSFLDQIARRVPMRLQKAVAAVLFAAYAIFGLFRLAEQTMFGFEAKRLHVIVELIGVVFFMVFGPGLFLDFAERDEERKRRELEYDEYEKSIPRDPAAEEQIRRDIGMPSKDRWSGP